MLKREILEKTLGKGAADKEDEVYLDAGPQLTFTRRQLTDVVGATNWNSLRKLNTLLHDLDIKSPAQLNSRHPGDLLSIPGVGETCIKMAMCILDYYKYSVTKWWGWEQEGKVVRFSAFKARLIAKAKKRKAS
jgi:hypothetical protein